MQPVEIWPGRSYPLGATALEGGTNFSLFSQLAERVELCLFEEGGQERRVDLTQRTAFCWHGFIPGVGEGQRYGFRVHGPYQPEHGSRCSPSKLLLDPYARAIEGGVTWNASVYAGNDVDSAASVPRSIVVAGSFDWGEDAAPRTRWDQSVIYEMHVKGFTKTLPGVPEPLRGTYAGLASEAALDHLTGLGVTALELMPVHQFVHDAELVRRGLRNYWGYMPIGFFAPHNEYSSGGGGGDQVGEFKAMVKALHRAGLEVILDVVYNHTAEAGSAGPTLCFRGIDNLAYYRTDPARPGEYVDYTGVGNTLNIRHPNVLQLVMDSLRYWIQEMHVDGFRFDLAPALARGLHDMDRLSAFFEVIQQDPVISQVKLIAEPWDVGYGGYQVGNFPVLWSEWNGKYRDAMRELWRGGPVSLRELSWRLAGSPDLYSSDGRQPYNSINFITSHDGFTLSDLVSYDAKHNEPNGEGNRDGDNANRSWNCGAEGPTHDSAINSLRRRQRRNLLATLLLSQGVPMLLAGDEIGRTQLGNNNAYCQDNEISWLDWQSADGQLLEFARRLVRLRHGHTALRRSAWSRSIGDPGSETGITWSTPEGLSIDPAGANDAAAVAALIDGTAVGAVDYRGTGIEDDDFMILINPTASGVSFQLRAPAGGGWITVVDTARDDDVDPVRAAARLTVGARSLVCLRSERARSAQL
ncbi:MAG TPA: glycogen debranching protein GlgX [Candidatus Udaeobacter sp.]|nr:glycogen debranching protein GlgX [Candidatus Udaeobacter sp.]